MTDPIGERDIEDFARDGVVCLRGVLDRPWIERLRVAVDRVKARPGPLRQRLRPEDGGEFFSEKFLWTFDPDFRAMAFETGLAGLAGRLMGTDRVRLFHDQLLVKEPRTPAPSPWHQDMNYFPFLGRQVCSLWMPLDPVDRASGTLEFVRGSHRWHDLPFSREEVFKNAESAPRRVDDADAIAGEVAERQPDIDADRGRYDIVSWELAPGDAVAFSALSLHAAPGNSTDRRRRAISTRWLGDDVRFARKRVSMALPRDPGLTPGAPPDSDLFPLLWRREAAGTAR